MHAFHNANKNRSGGCDWSESRLDSPIASFGLFFALDISNT